MAPLTLSHAIGVTGDTMGKTTSVEAFSLGVSLSFGPSLLGLLAARG